ncbi:UDP-N-acetylenolpyruvoylglucosamine reductase, partial [Burkholderia cenocepacia]|nr:UDP-N-acetylenolpyruvoylglucosamine reductase [Burkholderia cenocepacia]
MPMPPDDSALSLLPDHPLAAHHTVSAAALRGQPVFVTQAAQFEALHRDPRVATLPQLVLGGGSNIVFTR